MDAVLAARPAAADTADTAAVRPGAGLPNVGASCYMNAVLQLFFPVDDFVFAHEDARLVVAYNMLRFQCQQGGVLRAEMEAFIIAVVGNPRAIGYDVRRQELTGHLQVDAAEFMSLVLLQCDASGASTLGFTVRTTCRRDAFPGVHSSAEGLCTVRADPYKALPLEIVGSTLGECLANFVTEERMDGPANDNLLELATPSGPQFVSGSRQRTLATLPRCLILPLNRFSFDKQTRRRSKLDKSVEVPELLDLAP
jgi:ubiquitin C-terminal hydrolase